MKTKIAARLLCLALTAGLTLTARQAEPEDIDIFSVDESNIVARPNVLIVLDNSSNWSRQSQQWPEVDASGRPLTQGQSEAEAIKAALAPLDDSVNVGLLEFITGGSASDEDSGYIRHHIRPLDATNKAALNAKLDKIYNDINTPEEKRPQSNPFGTLFWDVYNYLAGENASNGGAGTPATLADSGGYLSQYGRFRSPLTSADTCTRTVVIFIGNNVSSGPSADSTTNVNALKALAGGGAAGDAAVAQIPFADYAIVTAPAKADLGYSSACFSSVSACSSAINNTSCTDQGFTSCACNTTAPIACPSTHWSVVGTQFNQTASITNTSGPNTTTDPTGDNLTSCQTAGSVSPLDTTATCPSNSDNGPPTASTPSGTYTRTQSSWASCKYYPKDQVGCTGSSKYRWENRGSHTVTTTTYSVTTTTSQTTLGDTAACYNDAATCSTTGFSCSGFNGGCACTTATTTTGCPAGTTSRFKMDGNYTTIEAKQLETFHAAPSGPFMMDEWTRFLNRTGVPLPGGGGARSLVTTYTIDVFNTQQHPDFSGLLFNAARVTGGKYYQAKNKNALINALREIFTEVQAVNSAFSSASLPVNATNRAQNENQVFIGVFRPDRTKKPRWFGNLKRYQLISAGTAIDLGDQNGNRAINPNTGFITECAVSYWSVDSTFNGVPYWQNQTSANPPPLGSCTTNTTSDLSDSPDGPFVEKGAAAEVLRRGNNPAAVPDADGNFDLNRTVYTSSASLTSGATPLTFDTTNTGLPANIVDWTRGMDNLDEDVDTPAARALTEPRASIHGDVVHSRPQPLNFGGSTGVVIFYGANDGMFHAVKASNGVELWSFVAPEFYGKLQRLHDNSPVIHYFGDPAINTAPKDYFFDGSTGVYQTFDSSGVSNKAWIFPSMRRGGNKVYALDVTTPTAPKYLWSKGCSNDYSTCDAGFSAIGQTWSLPNVALIKGYNSGTKPVVIFGGGYDACDDLDLGTCSATRGRGVFVVDAETGALVKYFDFSSVGGGGVVADVALIDVDADKLVDYAYAVDTAGNVFRMDFMDPTTRSATSSGAWISSRIAYTSGANRKFLFAPALVQATANVVYLAVGSGDREHPLMGNFPYTQPVLNRFYVFKDNITDTDSATKLNLDDPGVMNDYTTATTCATDKVTPSATAQGWFMNLNANGRGEQTVTSAVIAAGFVFFSTNRPTPPDTVACSTSLGEARGYFVNLLTASGAIGNGTAACGGTRSSTFVGGGLPPSPVLATVPINGELKTVVIGAVQKSGESSSPIESQRVRPPISSRRNPVYWYKSSGEK